MNCLIDTHILLWWLDDPSVLSEKSRKGITDGSNNIYVSSATIWEIVLKKQIGKLEIPSNIEEAIEENRFLYLSIEPRHAFALEKLPDIHRDPFDRIMIAQATTENLVFITRDKNIMKYELECIEG